jgi:hypothetical protein
MIKDFKENIKKFFQKKQDNSGENIAANNIEESELVSNIGIKRSQSKLVLYVLTGILALIVIIIKITGERKKEVRIDKEEKEAKVQVELASDNVNGDKLWQNLF